MKPLLEVEDLSVAFSVRGKKLHAVRGISFAVGEGEAVGIVGESGSGKTAAVQALAGLTLGEVSGKTTFDREKNRIGMVFQDPMTALNPTMKIGAQLTEGLLYHRLASRKEAEAKALEMLHLVGIADPELRLAQYPHQLSGGMRQRVLIAIALICRPRLLIADEPTTALDVSVQVQILALIQEMQRHFQMSLLLISHDFSVVSRVCDRILVMYAGKIVETGRVEDVLERPQHPYTQMLLASRPRLDQPRDRPLQIIEGLPPNPLLLPPGCPFKARCPHVARACEIEPPGPIACWRRK